MGRDKVPETTSREHDEELGSTSKGSPFPLGSAEGEPWLSPTEGAPRSQESGEGSMVPSHPLSAVQSVASTEEESPEDHAKVGAGPPGDWADVGDTLGSVCLGLSDPSRSKPELLSLFLPTLPFSSLLLFPFLPSPNLLLL